jgi:hypothetical protein
VTKGEVFNRSLFTRHYSLTNKPITHYLKIIGKTMENNKKIAAATAAVMNYIMTEEEAICIESMAGPSVLPAPAPYAATPVKLWGVSGRQSQMQMRNMMQMRTFR